jgi:hypothetical protein
VARNAWHRVYRAAPRRNSISKGGSVGESDLAAQADGGITLFTGRRFGIVTGGDYRRNWHGLRWNDFTVYVGISFRTKSEE